MKKYNNFLGEVYETYCPVVQMFEFEIRIEYAMTNNQLNGIWFYCNC